MVRWNGIGGLRRQRYWWWRVSRVLEGSRQDHGSVDQVGTLTDKRDYGGNSELGMQAADLSGGSGEGCGEERRWAPWTRQQSCVNLRRSRLTTVMPSWRRIGVSSTTTDEESEAGARQAVAESAVGKSSVMLRLQRAVARGLHGQMLGSRWLRSVRQWQGSTVLER